MITVIFLTMQAYASEFIVNSEEELNAALGNLQPGDSLVFAAGDFELTETMAWDFSGTASAPITVRGQEGATIIIGGSASAAISLTTSMWVNIEDINIQGNSSWESGSFYGIYLDDVEDVTVSNVRISSVPSGGIRLTGDSERVVIQDSEIAGTVDGSGIEVGCSDVSCYVEESTLRHNLIHDIAGSSQPAVHLHHGTQGVSVVDTVIYNTESYGIWLGSTENGVQNGADANAIWNTGDTGIVIQGAAMVRNNIVFNINGKGLTTINPDRDSYDTMIISFNTIVNTESWGMVLNDWHTAEVSVLANNVIYNPAGRSVRMTYDETANHPGTVNLISRNMISGWVDGLEYLDGHFEIGHGWADFVDVEGWNFYPAAGSTILDSANPSGDTYIPSYDFNGVQRDGGTPDIGAYEFDGSVNPGWAVQEDFKSFDLNYPQTDDVIGGCGNKNTSQAAGWLLCFSWLCLFGYRRKE